MHVYSVEGGCVVGSWDAHEDAVSCCSVIERVSHSPAVCTASWDGTIKVGVIRKEGFVKTDVKVR